MGILNTALDLLTWRTDIPQRAKAVPRYDYESSDFINYRSEDTPYYSSSALSQSLAHAVNPEIVRDAYVKVGTIWSCIRLIAEGIAEASIKVYERDAEGKAAEDPRHQVRDILEQPNPEQSEPEFIYAMTTVALVCGYTILEHNRDRAGRTVELFPRNPDRWKRRELAADKYVWEVGDSRGRTREVRDEDVSLVPYAPHPKLMGRGVSPIRAIEMEAGIENRLTAFLAAYLDRGAIIPHVLTTDQPIYDPAYVARLQTNWQQYQSGGAIDRPPVFSGGLKVQQVGGAVNDMAWPDLRGITELKICQAFNVQPHLVGAKDAIANGGLATTELGEAMTFHQRYTVNPIRRRQAGILTRDLLRQYEPERTWYLAYDLDMVLALQEQRNLKHERARADLLASGITVDEYRQETGREPLPNGRGEVRLVPFNVLETPIDEDPAPPPAPAKAKSLPAPEIRELRPGAAPPAENFLSRAQPIEYKWRDLSALSPAELRARTRIARNNRQRQDQLARKVQPKLKTFFHQQGRRIVSELRKSNAPTFAKAINDIDWISEDEKLRSILEPHYNLAGAQAVDDVNTLLDTQAIWEIANAGVQEIWTEMGTRITGINETTRIQVAKEVADSLEAGVTLEELQAALQGLFEETYTGRAMTIARTESQYAYNSGSAFGYEQAGEVDEIELFDNPDHTEDYHASDHLTCAQRNRLIRPLADAQKHIRAEHPNGTLAIGPIIKKDQPEETKPLEWSASMSREDARKWVESHEGIYADKSWYHFTGFGGAEGIPKTGLKPNKGLYGPVGYTTEHPSLVLGSPWADKRVELLTNIKNPLELNDNEYAAEINRLTGFRFLEEDGVKKLQEQGYDAIVLTHNFATNPDGSIPPPERWLLTFEPESTTVVNVDDTPGSIFAED